MAKKTRSRSTRSASTARRTSAAKKTRSRRGSGKRELMTPRGDARYVRRSGTGRFKESDDVGRSTRTDRPKKARTAVKSGYGDRGDRKRGG